MDRRHFLSTSLAAVTVPALASASADGLPLKPSAAVAGPSTTDAVPFGEARFRGLLGSHFRFKGDDWRGSLKLTEVVSRTSDTRLEQFTTIFRAEGAALPAPGVYAVNHPDMGRFNLRIDGRHDSDVRQATFALLRG